MFRAGPTVYYNEAIKPQGKPPQCLCGSAALDLLPSPSHTHTPNDLSI